MGAKKNFVLDTNVILHDYKCIYNFQENDIYIPIVVLEELDKFKKGNEQINYNAREFVRELDNLSIDADFFKNGASLGMGLGKLFIVTNPVYPEILSKSFSEKTPDHRIMAVALDIQQKAKKTRTILVTKDVNLRMKAKSIGLDVEDYINDKVTNVDLFDKAQETYDNVDPDLVDRIYAEAGGVAVSDCKLPASLAPNECFILKSCRSTVMAKYDASTQTVKKVKKEKAFGIEGRNAEQTFALDVLLNEDIKLVAITGRAGTGKTLLALAAALQQHETYKQILLARPIVAMSNKDLGFLPGDEKQKVAPYMQPLFDNLNVIKHQFGASSKELRLLDDMQKSEQLVIEALAFIRGRSLSNTYLIVDEAQNLTPHEVKTIITRAGEGCKIVFTGDVQQIDTPYLDMQSNGLVYMIDKMKGQDLFAHVNLIKGERSKLSELASVLL
ncbi:MAG: PhoH family protein [Paludibacteraceae bacterium]|nr:PhoH family protein [Paludibacteraceae bacterium]MBR5972289.1 PhoH family protein [Paludibacteraceae bacterium]